MPEPWATRLVLEGGGHVLVDEADLWPDGRVRHDPPDRRHGASSTSTPTSSAASSTGSVDAIDAINADPAAAQTAVNDGIEAITDEAASPTRRSPAPGRTSTFTARPDRLVAAGLGRRRHRRRPARRRSTSPTGIYDLTLLNEVLAERGEDVDGRAGCDDERRLAARRVTKTFGVGSRRRRPRCRDVDLDVGRGEFVCLDRRLGLRQVDDPQPRRRARPADRRRRSTSRAAPALMFQESALFPWLTVAANVELPMRLAGVAKRRAPASVPRSCSTTVHLDGFGEKRPHQLSGGMRQRAALARAFAQDADILLMDEPFGALDAMTRDVLHDELETLVRGTAA